MRRRSERKKSVDEITQTTPASRRTSRRSRKSPLPSEPGSNTNVTELQVANSIIEEDEVLTSSDADEGTQRKSRATRHRAPANCASSSPSKPPQHNSQHDTEPESKPLTTPPKEDLTDSKTPGQQNESEEYVQKDADEITETTEEKGQGETTMSTEFIAKLEVEKDTQNSLDVLEIQADEQDQEQEQVEKFEEKAATAEIQISRDTSRGSSSSGSDDHAIESAPSTVSNSTLDTSATRTKNKSAENSPIMPPLHQVNEHNDPVEATTNNAEPHAAVPENLRMRKRKWITKKTAEIKHPILSISTDSLKNLIADVHPVPLSDVQLESSSDVEEVASDREEGEETPSSDYEPRRISIDKIDKVTLKSKPKQEALSSVPGDGATGALSIQRSPSPARNQSSSVLYITNLVRPFTVLQLKGLLARTGKIVEDGFWIDRIKSKCYVHYETEDEAIETRHALHGVRWPVSNPKCLNVEFAHKSDMDRVIETTKNDAPKFGQDGNKDNIVVGTGWSRERNGSVDTKAARPVREWDVGKKGSLDRDKSRDHEKRRSREREMSGNRENDRERSDKDRKKRVKDRRDGRSNSLSPAHKIKKKEGVPPPRLLDDLFRKTKATPCVYWLPLTPEQIAEKEAMRQKRIEEQKLRLKQRELEEKERKESEKERNRRDRERDQRRRSRSRDRRRY